MSAAPNHDCHASLATSLALGMEIPALPGMHAWETRIFATADGYDLDPPADTTLGLYPDRDSALRALAIWIVSQWAEVARTGLDAPWTHTAYDPDTWLAHTTISDIINKYFVGNPYESYTVRQVRISPALPNAPLTLADRA